MVAIKYEMPGRCVSAGTLVPNYGAANVAPILKDQSLLSSKRRPHSQTYKWSRNEQILVTSPVGTRSQEQLCWRRTAAI
jgi:hypothetical protein